jgi:hypothetical protein
MQKIYFEATLGTTGVFTGGFFSATTADSTQLERKIIIST